MKRTVWLLGLIVVGCVLVNCNASYTIVMPYCPWSDSAKAKADSVPVGCLVGDTTRVKK